MLDLTKRVYVVCLGEAEGLFATVTKVPEETLAMPDGLTVKSGKFTLKFDKKFELEHSPKFSLCFSIEADPEVVEFIRVLNEENRYIQLKDSPITLPYVTSYGTKIEDDGRLNKDVNISERFLPKAVQERFKEILSDASIGLSKTFGALMFINDNWEMHTPRLSIYWGHSRNKPKHALPRAEDEFLMRDLGSRPWLRWGEKEQLAFSALNAEKFDCAPLWFELLSEARRLKNAAPRSSLLTGYSSMEIGVKSFLTSRIPSAKYLIENTPSPPIYKLLKNNMRSLGMNNAPADFWVSSSWRAMCRTVQLISELRNDIAHGNGNSNKLDNELAQYLRDIKHLLFFLEFLNGRTWALNHLDYRFKGDWPEASGPEARSFSFKIGVVDPMSF